ncbi:Alcohol dehydrogenase GroES domain protein [Gemmatirosa kalamazoonensis]|uniref:Alcohol dehydrogenase GroES domain protein n=1 Tax=Gemmatirosa kalamazoonensis TaxID=861299 RepID=W0RKP4_9BACT|nr:zinc-dependent alcohol dehydrogenase [Gemmatirosa kalamazoonensis]AHG91326.1 Alcohol dehydrogenase GroES domain protein [Gemmatirosa kalamazoonensis]
MKALCWHGVEDLRCERVPDPEIVNPRDAIVRVTSTAICGSDLHLYDGMVPSMMKGDILGHEFMGVVEEVGRDVRNLRPGDRVLVPFAIACGNCWYCHHDLWSLCDNSNPNAAALEALNGYSTSGLFGYSHLYGGYAGGQAEYVRVPFADVGPLKLENDLPDEKVLFLTDIFPTGYMAAEQCGIRPGDTVAVWGCGPVGQFAIVSAYLLGAGRVIAIDRFAERLDMAREVGNADVVDYARDTDDVVETLKQMTGGRGPDHAIDAVDMESHGHGVMSRIDRGKQFLKLQLDRADALRQAVQACGKGGTVSIPGVYAGFIDKFPMGQAFAKGLTLRMGQTHVHRYLRPLLERIERGDVDPSRIITHRVPLERGPEMYRTFRDKQDGCVKVVLKPELRAV